MFSYLSKLDQKMIQGMQWIIRQMELYTSMTRRDVLDVSLLISGATLILFFVVVSIVANKNVVSIIALAAHFMLCYVLLKEQCREAKKKTQPLALPGAIVSRKPARFVAAVFTSLWLQIHFRFIAVSADSSLIGIVLVIILSSHPYQIFLHEYLLCTTSLPPGEKERKKQECEARNLVPIRA